MLSAPGKISAVPALLHDHGKIEPEMTLFVGFEDIFPVKVRCPGADRGGPGRDQVGEMWPDERSSGNGIFEKPGTNAL